MKIEYESARLMLFLLLVRRCRSLSDNFRNHANRWAFIHVCVKHQSHHESLYYLFRERFDALDVNLLASISNKCNRSELVASTFIDGMIKSGPSNYIKRCEIVKDFYKFYSFYPIVEAAVPYMAIVDYCIVSGSDCHNIDKSMLCCYINDKNIRSVQLLLSALDPMSVLGCAILEDTFHVCLHRNWYEGMKVCYDCASSSQKIEFKRFIIRNAVRYLCNSNNNAILFLSDDAAFFGEADSTVVTHKQDSIIWNCILAVIQSGSVQRMKELGERGWLCPHDHILNGGYKFKALFDHVSDFLKRSPHVAFNVLDAFNYMLDCCCISNRVCGIRDAFHQMDSNQWCDFFIYATYNAHLPFLKKLFHCTPFSSNITINSHPMSMLINFNLNHEKICRALINANSCLYEFFCTLDWKKVCGISSFQYCWCNALFELFLKHINFLERDVVFWKYFIDLTCLLRNIQKKECSSFLRNVLNFFNSGYCLSSLGVDDRLVLLKKNMFPSDLAILARSFYFSIPQIRKLFTFVKFREIITSMFRQDGTSAISKLLCLKWLLRFHNVDDFDCIAGFARKKVQEYIQSLIFTAETVGSQLPSTDHIWDILLLCKDIRLVERVFSMFTQIQQDQLLNNVVFVPNFLGHEFHRSIALERFIFINWILQRMNVNIMDLRLGRTICAYHINSSFIFKFLHHDVENIIHVRQALQNSVFAFMFFNSINFNDCNHRNTMIDVFLSFLMSGVSESMKWAIYYFFWAVCRVRTIENDQQSLSLPLSLRRRLQYAAELPYVYELLPQQCIPVLDEFLACQMPMRISILRHCMTNRSEIVPYLIQTFPNINEEYRTSGATYQSQIDTTLHAVSRRQSSPNVDASIESSMNELTVEEKTILSTVRIRYEPLINLHGGVAGIVDHFKRTMREKYTESPSVYKDIVLPFDFNALQKLATREKWNDVEMCHAKITYYTNFWHTAARYVMIPNRWIHSNALRVHVNETNPEEKWAMFDDPKCLLIFAIYWLAATDARAEMLEGFTVERNIELFARAVALINRAHNSDQVRMRKIRSADGTICREEEEEYDDLTGDKPSCLQGIQRRLLTMVPGNILCRAMDVLGTAKSFIEECVVQKLNALSISNLQTMFDAVTAFLIDRHMDNDEDKFTLMTCNLSEEDHIACIAAIKQKFPIHVFEIHREKLDALFETSEENGHSHVIQYAFHFNFADALKKKEII